jgi:hypothetical protein
MAHIFLGGYEDHVWCTTTRFGSGVAKALLSYIAASSGGSACLELDYGHLVDRFEFTEGEIRAAIGHLLANGHARINSRHPHYSGDVLEPLTPGRLAEDARLAEKERAQAAQRAAKIALRGGRVNRASIPDEVRSFVFERDGHSCLRCGATEGLTLDHIHPWSIGGPDTADNLQVLCRPCNSSKGDRVA